MFYQVTGVFCAILDVFGDILHVRYVDLVSIGGAENHRAIYD